MLNMDLLKNPLNYFVVGTMALIGLLIVSYISAPLRAAQSAQ